MVQKVKHWVSIETSGIFERRITVRTKLERMRAQPERVSEEEGGHYNGTE